MFNIVLFNPQIPQNTGTIGRLCVNADARLHIIKPICFEITDKNIRRAGLDYWDKLDIKIWDSLEHFLSIHSKDIKRFFFSTTKSDKAYFNAKFQDGDYLIFGSESHGLPMDLMKQNWQNAITIPMGENGRSLNLAISVGIVLYDAIRQTS